jgi:hypothetical protein
VADLDHDLGGELFRAENEKASSRKDGYASAHSTHADVPLAGRDTEIFPVT